MAEGRSVVVLGVFIGCIAFIASMGAGDVMDIEGLDKVDDVSVEPEDIEFNISNYLSASRVENVSGEDDNGVNYTGLSWNGSGENGTISYDVSGVDNIEIDLIDPTTFGFLSESAIFYDGATGNEIASLSGDGVVGVFEPVNVTDVDEMEIVLTDEDAVLVGFNFPVLEDNDGLLERLSTLVGIFSLDSDTPWVSYIVVLPLTLFGLYILIDNAGDYIPFT